MPIPDLPRIEPSETDLAWAAGIIDGEGCIQIRKRDIEERRGRNTPGWVCMLRVSNTDIRMTNRLWQLFGGRVQGARMIRLSSRPYFEWHGDGAPTMSRVLKMILPYLVVKRDQAEVAIQFAATMWKGGKGPARLPQSIVQERDGLIAEILRLRAPKEEAV